MKTIKCQFISEIVISLEFKFKTFSMNSGFEKKKIFMFNKNVTSGEA